MKGVISQVVERHLPSSVLPSAQGQTGHLGSDADAALVQDANGVLVPQALLTQQVALGDVDVVEVEHAGAAGADAQLLLLLGDAEPGRALLDDEGADALVPLAGVEVGEDDEDARLHRVGDPHLGPVELVPVRRPLRLGLQREGVRPGRGLRQAERAHGARGQLGQPGALGLGVAVPHDDGVDEGVVDVDHDADAGVDAGQLLDGHDGRREVHAGPAVLLGDLDAHQPLLEQLLHQDGVHGLRFIHLPDFGADLLLGELGDLLGHQGLGFGQLGDRGGGEGGQVDIPPAGGGREGAGADKKRKGHAISIAQQYRQSWNAREAIENNTIVATETGGSVSRRTERRWRCGTPAAACGQGRPLWEGEHGRTGETEIRGDQGALD